MEALCLSQRLDRRSTAACCLPWLIPSWTSGAKTPTRCLAEALRMRGATQTPRARAPALSQTTTNRKVEVRKLLIFQSPIFGFSR